MFEKSYKIRVSARAIVIHNEKLLLNEFGNGKYYNFPGGGIEKNETALKAVIREVEEETGLFVEADQLLFTLEYEPFSCNYLYGDGHHISLLFCCNLIGSSELTGVSIPDVSPDNPTLVSCPKWIPILKLTKINLVPHINNQLLKYIDTGVFAPIFYEETNS